MDQPQLPSNRFANYGFTKRKEAPDDHPRRPVPRIRRPLSARQRRARRRASAATSGSAATPAPLFFDHGRGAHLVDVDGNGYVDYVARAWAPASSATRPPAVVAAVRDAGSTRGQLFAGPDRRPRSSWPSCSWPAGAVRGTGPLRQLRHRDGAGGAAGRPRGTPGAPPVVKFEGHYHGWLDPILRQPRPAARRRRTGRRAGPQPPSARPDRRRPADSSVLPVERRRRRSSACSAGARDRIAAVIMEPILCNTSAIVPRARLPGSRARACDAPRHRPDLRRGDHRLPGRRRVARRSCSASRRTWRSSPRRWAAVSRSPRSPARAT